MHNGVMLSIIYGDTEINNNKDGRVMKTLTTFQLQQGMIYLFKLLFEFIITHELYQ